MAREKIMCMKCDLPMTLSSVAYKGVNLNALKCSKCKEKIFTEKLAMDAMSKLESKRLEEEYVKHPIKIGHSWGITFPKEVAKVFGLENSKTNLRIHPDVKSGIIKITVN